MKLFIPLLSLIITQSLWAQGTLLVTDIDDTIKVSNVLEYDSAVANARSVKNAFMGMPELYQALIKYPQATPMHYLSNAPEWLMRGWHEEFIKMNKFPEGPLVLSESTMANGHKVKSLREMIKKFNPSTMILIGDNGEKDSEVYAQIREEFPEIKGPTYIHIAYSRSDDGEQMGKPLLKDQIGWATSVDLAQNLMEKGFITLQDYINVINSVEDRTLKEDPEVEREQQMMFPAWFDCRDFLVPVMSAVSDQFQEHVRNRCAREPYED